MIQSGKTRRFGIVVRGRSIDMAFWIKMTLAVGILFIIPLEFSYYGAIQQDSTPNFYDVRIQFALLYYVDWRDSDFPPVNLNSPMTIAAAIAICIPAILLNRRIRNHEPEESIREAGVAALFGTAIAAIFLVDYFPPSDLLWLFQTSPAGFLNRFGTLVIIALIVLPMLLREAFHSGLQRRHEILALTLSLLATLMPTAITIRYPVGGANYISFSSTFQFWLETLGPEPQLGPISQINMTFIMFNTMNFLYGLLFSGMGFIYVHYIIRYLRGQASSRNALFFGFAGFLISYTYFGYREGLIGPQYPLTVIPLPILLILGIVVIASAESQVSYDTLEEQLDTRVEFGESKEVSESVTVPMVYILKSKLVDFKKRIARRRNRS